MLFDFCKVNVEINGINFIRFVNDIKLFDLYSNKQNEFYFTNNFEYINKININRKYNVVYLENDGFIYLYIYDLNKNKLIAYNFESYKYLLNEYDISLDIKFVSDNEVIQNDIVIDYSNEYVDAVYYPDGLSSMSGKRYSKIRGNRNNFLHHIEFDKLCFREYHVSDKQQVLELYSLWKETSINNGNNFIVDANIFKNGLDNTYLHKFVLLYGSKLIGFISFLICKEFAFIYSMKSSKEIPNQNTYMVHLSWKYIYDNFTDIKYINLGSIDNIDAKETDYKMLLKPDEFIKYYSNVRVIE